MIHAKHHWMTRFMMHCLPFVYDNNLPICPTPRLSHSEPPFAQRGEVSSNVGRTNSSIFAPCFGLLFRCFAECRHQSRSQLSRLSSAAALKRALVDDATAMKLEQAHSQPPVNPSDSAVVINEHAPNARSGCATTGTACKIEQSASAAAIATVAPVATLVQTVDYGRKLFEIDNVCLHSPVAILVFMHFRRYHSKFRRVVPILSFVNV